VTPEMYAVPWFLTYFAKVILQPELILTFWDEVARRRDVAQTFFFAVALVVYHEKIINEAQDFQLPEVMTSFKIESSQELKVILEIASTIEQATPLSFRRLSELNIIFKKETVPQMLQEQCLRLENYSCLPVLPAELFFYSYPELIECADPICSLSYEGLNSESHTLVCNDSKGEIDLCNNCKENQSEVNKIRKQRFILVDCRLQAL